MKQVYYGGVPVQRRGGRPGPRAQRPEAFYNSKVTRGRLYPHLENLLQNRQIGKSPNRNLYSRNAHSNIQASEVPNLPLGLMEALREHVYNNMPLRLIQLPYMKLVERNEVVNLIAIKMAGIDESLIASMEAKIDALGKERPDVSTQETEDLEEEDARDNVWDTICHFLFQEFARYAILSHTWLQTDPEIVYQNTFRDNWLEPYGTGNAGYDKLKGFCDVAYNEHDVSLAWIDTLCINKDSSSELDESIQSMYKWYQKASICITYLNDTTSLVDMESDNWFRRGWTLQELIAPNKMQFYNWQWKRLIYGDGNDKANTSVQDIIYQATGITRKELVSFDPLTGSDIATRMAWAAYRTTTRGEDRAYSLMGIFGVNFPISYGEGAERAFFRLIEAIITSRHTSHIMRTLNWAGKSISDTIHASRLIPSRPECYVTDGSESLAEDWKDIVETSRYYFPALSKPMSLTHLGLRVRLLFVSATLVSLDKLHSVQRYGPFDINISLKFPSSSFEPITQLLDKRYSEVPARNRYPTRKPTPCGSSFFLGIYTFKEDIHDDRVQIPLLSSAAFILHIPNPFRGFKIRDLTSNHFEPGTKIDTRNVVRVRSILGQDTVFATGSQSEYGHFEEDSFNAIRKEDLAAMNMKLLNVYL